MLREKLVTTEEKADTLAKQIYFVVQIIHLEGGIDNRKQHHPLFFDLVRKFLDIYSSEVSLEPIGKIGSHLFDNKGYQAPPEARMLIAHEETFNRPGAAPETCC